MKQERAFSTEFSCGGFVIFSDGSEYPVFLYFKDSELLQVSIPKERNDEDFYLHSKSIKYDLSDKKDISRLKRKGVIGCKYETPTTMSLTYDKEMNND